MPLTQVSARFFLELALGLFAGLLLTDRKSIGAGYTRLTVAFTLASLLPGVLLLRSSGGPAPAPWAGIGFGVACALLLALAGRLPPVIETLLATAATLLGATALVAALHSELPEAAARGGTLAAASGLASTLVLGLVTGAMILGHWYLVTPDLPVSHLGRLTRVALASIYVKLALFALTAWFFGDRFAGTARTLGAVVGLGDATGTFQNQLDALFLLARVLIGLIGPLVLCHMTMATIRLKATQPATGILYAATVMVLMGELFAFVAERSFGVVV